jgi:hypothetical protein
VGAAASDQPEGLVAGYLKTPGDRGIRSAASVSASPGSDERFLDRFLGVVRATQDPKRLGGAPHPDQ